MAEQNRRDIYILVGFNNYFNRTIKYYSELIDYLGTLSTYTNAENINFKPNDDVSTEIILNVGKEYSHADYLLVMNGNDIESRWFIQHEHRTRNGQYQFTLRRDVIADNLQALQTSPIFVERAWLRDDNPLIYADEGMTLNQIKSNETLLKDKTGIGWIVGYFKRDTGNVTAKTPTYNNDLIVDNSITLQEVANQLQMSLNDLLDIINLEKDNGVLVDKINGGMSFDAWINKTDGHNWEFLVYCKVNQYFEQINNYIFLNQRFDKNIQLYRIGMLDPYASYDGYEQLAKPFRDALNTYMADLKANWWSLIGRKTLTQAQLNTLQSISNTYSYIRYNNVYYRLKIDPQGTINREFELDRSHTLINNIINYTNNIISSNVSEYVPSSKSGIIITKYQATQLSLILELADVGTYEVAISQNANRCVDAQYKMFAIPYGKINYSEELYTSQETRVEDDTATVQGSGYGLNTTIKFLKRANYTKTNERYSCTRNGIKFNDYSVTTREDSQFYYYDIKVIGNGLITFSVTVTWNISTNVTYPIIKQTELSLDDAINVACAISEEMGGDTSAGKLYDLQLLPYCPCLDFYDEANNAFLVYSGNPKNLRADYDFTTITTKDDANKKTKGLVFFPTSCNIRIVIDYYLGLTTNPKVDSNCDTYRLVSPNGSGGFDFNIAKNGGSVNYFVVDCTYKPYTPYIRIAPQFKELYGANYHDTRGLICGGDFSLPIMNDPWTNYQLQNKNYANIFDRDIQNLDFRQSREQRMQELTLPLKILSSGIQGGVQGFQATGSPYGAIAGAGIGLTAGAVGSGVDLAMATELRGENRRYAIDKFNFNMGNIKALPTSMSRNTSYTINNKIFPYLEYYTCTEEEREAFERKIEWDSMIVMKIGYLTEYQIPNEPHYFKGRLIRGIDVNGDQHILQEINDELEKGVYI